MDAAAHGVGPPRGASARSDLAASSLRSFRSDALMAERGPRAARADQSSRPRVEDARASCQWRLTSLGLVAAVACAAYAPASAARTWASRSAVPPLAGSAA